MKDQQRELIVIALCLVAMGLVEMQFAYLGQRLQADVEQLYAASAQWPSASPNVYSYREFDQEERLSQPTVVSPQLYKKTFAEQRQEKQDAILNNPIVQQNILEFREEIFRSFEVPASEVKEWKLVGLERTSSLRSQQLENECNMALREDNTACITVERVTTDPSQHITMYASLDAMYAPEEKLSERIMWMKPGSLVLSPSSTAANTLTQLGSTLQQSNLNHVGIPPSNSDTTTSPPAIDAIRRFLLLEEPSTRCRDWEQRAGGQFVLYNINCRVYNDQAISPHSFYWKEPNDAEE